MSPADTRKAASDDLIVDARMVAAKAVHAVLTQGQPLETALSSQAAFDRLDSRDRAFARLMVATVFRRMGQIDHVLKQFLKRPAPAFPMALLRIGAAQLMFLKTPAHAAVGETVMLAKRSGKTRGFAGLINAVLRRTAEQGAALAAQLPPKSNIPAWIYNSWEKAYGRSQAQRMAAMLIKDPPLDLNVKSTPEIWAEQLSGQALFAHTVRLDQASNVPDLAGFSQGEWWVQDLAATLPVLSMGDIKGKQVLDMCAAPGGKTLQLATQGAQVTALDKSETRMARVRDNLERTGLKARLIVTDALTWQADTDFDIILIDAPCSATGTYRRHPDVLYNKNPKMVQALQKIQRQLLNHAATQLKPGGEIVYCTCSLQPDEGEAQIKRFLSQNPNFTIASPECSSAGLIADVIKPTPDGYIRALPHFISEKGGMDGFFSVRLMKQKILP